MLPMLVIANDTYVGNVLYCFMMALQAEDIWSVSCRRLQFVLNSPTVSSE